MYHHTKCIAAATILLGLVTMPVRPAQADFTLSDNEEITVDISHEFGRLYEQSTAHIVANGWVKYFTAYDSSVVDISGGGVADLTAHNSSVVNMSGGSMDTLLANNTSTVNMSGGSMEWLYANHTSTVTFNARDFFVLEEVGDLSLDGDRVRGTFGVLGGKWFDGTPWTVNIATNEGTIRAVPEPSALMLMAVALLGGLLLRKRFNSVKPM